MKFRISAYSFFGLIVVACFFSCSQTTDKETTLPEDAPVETTAVALPPNIVTESLELKVFEITDPASKKTSGWGYDVYAEGKLSIHQPIIPGLPGNRPFETYELAEKTGVLAIKKMKETGSLPTITIDELKCIGITN